MPKVRTIGFTKQLNKGRKHKRITLIFQIDFSKNKTLFYHPILLKIVILKKSESQNSNIDRSNIDS